MFAAAAVMTAQPALRHLLEARRATPRPYHRAAAAPAAAATAVAAAPRGGVLPGGRRRCWKRSASPPGRIATPRPKPVLRITDAMAPGLELQRVVAVTDLHVDYEENMRWCLLLDGKAHKRDILVVCGDVSDELGNLEAALSCLADKFGHVFYVPGNHEMWVREPDRQAGVFDSVNKLQLIFDLCARLGVHTRPRRLGDLWIVPLLSWHHKSFDTEPDIPQVPPPSSWTIADYGACVWPPSVPGGSQHGSEELALWWDGLNETPEWRELLAARQGCDVISFSHFLPHQELLPEKRYLYYPNLTKAAGSLPLAARLARLQPDIHLFGHTHFAWDACFGGTRYIQVPLCSPLERQRRLFTVAYGACMDEAEQAPVEAYWLPQQVYVGLAPQPEAAAAAAAAAAPTDATVAAAAAAPAEEAAAPPAAAAAAAAPGSQPPCSQQQEAGDGRAEWLPPQQEQQPAGAGAEQAPADLPERSQLQLDMELRYGWQPLRHGAAVPQLLAHWSSYYDMNTRQPQIVQLAPWVERIWKRRRQRARAGAASRTLASGDGMATSGGETALSSLSQSEAESEGELGASVAASSIDSQLSSSDIEMMPDGAPAASLE